MLSVISSVSAVCLLALSGDVIPIVIRFVFPRFAPRRLAPRPACRVGGRGADGDACLPRDVVARGVALASWSCLGCGAVPWFILSRLCRPSRLTDSDRNEEWDGCGEAAAYPMRGWRRWRHAGSFDVATAGLAA